MKKPMPLLAVSAAAALVLAGCASGAEETDPTASPTTDPSGSAEPVAYDCAVSGDDAQGFGTDEDVAVLSALEWCVGEDDSTKVQFETPSTVSATSTLVVDPGEGEQVTDGKIVTLDYSITSGGDGSTLYSTYEAGAGETITLDETSFDANLWEALMASSEGAQIIFASIDSTATDPDQATVYMSLTVSAVSTPLASAEGEAVEPEAGLPTVTFGEDGIPTVAFDDAEKPAELVVQPLITGEGEPLEEGQTAVVHYTGWIWDGEQFDSSWDRGTPTSFPFVTGGLIEGWIEGLAGQPVGSRVLLVIPPELGYGAEGSGSIPGDSTLVFVVDILAAV